MYCPGAFLTVPTQPTTYTVSVTNACGAVITDQVLVDFNPPPTVIAIPDGLVSCIPTGINFTDNSVSGNSSDPITNWLWNFGDGVTSTSQNPTHTYSLSGVYYISLSVTTDAGCTNSNSLTPIMVYAEPYPTAAFDVNSTSLLIPFDELVCSNQSTGANTYNWNFGDGSTSTLTNPTYYYSTVGIYQIELIASSAHGCKDTAYREVITNADLIFPNAFTPNTNGPSGGYYNINSLDNDIFFPYTRGVADYKLQIFNRWGELIFETDDIKQGWDGYYRNQLCQVGVYVWKAYVKLNNGKVINKTGDVTLLK